MVADMLRASIYSIQPGMSGVMYITLPGVVCTSILYKIWQYLSFDSNSISFSRIPGATPDVQVFHWDIVFAAVGVPETRSGILLLLALICLIATRNKRNGNKSINK